MLKKDLVTDRVLLERILLGKTQEPISLDNWVAFVNSVTFSPENTLFYLDVLKYFYCYQLTCSKFGYGSNISGPLVNIVGIPGLIVLECNGTNESELKIWSERTCTSLVNTYVKAGSDLELNVSSKIRSDLLTHFNAGKYHPTIFNDIKEAVFASVVLNDMPKFKTAALDQNIELQHRRLRLYGGIICTIGITALYASLLSSTSSQYYRLLGLPLTYYLFLFYFQHKAKFCVTFADRKSRNVKGYMGVAEVKDEYACEYQGRRSKKIKSQSLLGGIILLIIFFVVPPYNW